LQRESFLEFLKKDVLKPDKEPAEDSEELKSSDAAEASDHADAEGEENRRKTILQIYKRNQKLKRLDSAQQVVHLRGDEDEEAKGVDLSGQQSDVCDELGPDRVNVQLFGDRQGPSKKKSSKTSSSNFNSNFTDQDQDAQPQSKVISERRRRSSSAVQDAISELWQSCRGSTFQKANGGQNSTY